MNTIIFILIGVTALISNKGFEDRLFFNKYMLRVGDVIGNKEYIRLLSSGFLHADWTHLLFNMISLYFFAPEILFEVGIYNFLAIYIGSMLAGNLASVYYNKDNYMYSAIGASGGVSGVIFSAIILQPGMSLYVFPIPIAIPGWLFGIAYVLYSIYGMKKQLGNIGHTAHLAGGLFGLIITLLFI